MTGTGIRANAVSVDKLSRARCHLPGCGWTGTEHATYQDANAGRLGHLAWHRQAAGESGPVAGRALSELPPGGGL